MVEFALAFLSKSRDKTQECRQLDSGSRRRLQGRRISGALSGLQADASRAQRSARQEYDRTVTRVLDTGDIEAKKRLAAVIDQLYELGGELPPRINENRRPPGANQISKGGTAV